MTQTRIGFINEHGMDLEELSARTVVTNCAGDFVDDFDMDAVEDDYEAAREVGTAPLSDDDWAAIEEGLAAIDMAAIFQAHDLTTK